MDNQGKDKKNKEFSREKGNIEIVRKDDGISIKEDRAGGSVSVSRDGIDVKKAGNLVIGSLNIMANPIKETLKERKRKHYEGSKFHLWADIILVLVIVGLLASFFILRNLKPNIDLGLKTRLVDDYATSGEIETFEIKYHNPSDMNLSDAGISVRLPENFTLVRVVPSNIFNQTTNTFEIGELKSGANGKILIQGAVLGEIGSRQVMNFSFGYKIGGKERNVLDSLVYSIEDSSISLAIDMPENIYKDVPFRGRLLIKNNGESDLESDLEFVLKESAIEIKSVNYPEATLNNNSITIAGLRSGEKAIIDFEAVAEVEKRSVQLLWQVYMSTLTGKIKQREVEDKVKISIPQFSARIEADRESASDNEAINFTLRYKNKESTPLSGLKMLFHTTDSAFRIEEFKVPESSDYQVSGTNIDFSKSIKPEEAGEIDIEVVFSRSNIGVNQEVALAADVNYSLEDKSMEYNIYSDNIRYLSDLQVGSKGVYYSAQGDQLGIGPLPPIVDVPTRYWIFWEVDNLGNELENVSVSAVLPNNVVYTDQKSLIAGKIRYGEITKKVVWSIDEVEAEDGEYRAGFEIELIPGEGDLGKTLDILKDIEYSAYDTFAEKEISGKLDNINTDLKDDQVASGQGKVTEMNVVR
ncbi:hypothetical protein GF382_00820 [Candidatus Falkowbacteria bacterium]|nr:hypothetical protein [Candidatus Falkowbacteria bacterium]